MLRNEFAIAVEGLNGAVHQGDLDFIDAQMMDGAVVPTVRPIDIFGGLTYIERTGIVKVHGRTTVGNGTDTGIANGIDGSHRDIHILDDMAADIDDIGADIPAACAIGRAGPQGGRAIGVIAKPAAAKVVDRNSGAVVALISCIVALLLIGGVSPGEAGILLDPIGVFQKGVVFLLFFIAVYGVDDKADDGSDTKDDDEPEADRTQ